MPDPVIAAVGTQHSSADTGKHLVAAGLSAFAPGAGHLLLGQKRKGCFLLAVYAVVIMCVWPLRLPRFFAGFVLLGVGWLALCIYAVCAGLFERSRLNTERISPWWLLLAPLFIYCGFNVGFTPVFLLAGFRARQFSSSSMEPTLLPHEFFIFDAGYYRRHPVDRDDLVMLRRADYETVKRVIAGPGDTIEGRRRTIILNGKLLEESFVEHSLPEGRNPQLDTFGPTTVPKDKFFVMGDNRDISLDSRSEDFGFLDRASILGRPLYVYRSSVKAHKGRSLN